MQLKCHVNGLFFSTKTPHASFNYVQTLYIKNNEMDFIINHVIVKRRFVK